MAWESHRAELIREHAGAWTLIARGKMFGAWDDFDDAWEVASSLPVSVVHAYLFRIGIDDVETTIQLPPISSENPLWVHLGLPSMQRIGLKLRFPRNIWMANGKEVTWGEQEARLILQNPGQTLRHEVRAVASSNFMGELTLRPIDAKALDLGRFTAPVPAYLQGSSKPCERIVLRVKIPELDVDLFMMAFVLPEHTNPVQ